MAVRMTHPRHGVTHAVGAEVAWNISNGWSVEPEQTAGQESTITAESEAPAAPSLSERYQAKFGKPPHHRMRPETIERALEDNA